jgi:hypothetical protein
MKISWKNPFRAASKASGAGHFDQIGVNFS